MNLPDIEVVSAEVHAAWIESKRRQGVTSRQGEDGEELMVAYALLSEKAKELDAAGLPGSQVLDIALQAAEQNGHKWPLRYNLK